MKKLLYILPLIAMSAMIAMPVLAQVGQENPPVENRDLSGWLQIIITITKWLYTILLVVAVIFVILAAFKYLTAGGDPTAVKKANSQLIYAVVAIVVAILAFSIKTIVTGIIK